MWTPYPALAAFALLACSATASAATVQGTITSELGEPLAGVTVYAYDLRLGYEIGISGADGGYSIDGLEPGLHRLRALPPTGMNRVARVSPSESSFCDGELVLLGEGESVGGVDVSLPAGALISGSLQDLRSEPVEGATVECNGADESTSGLARLGVSDGDGAFTVAGLDAPESGSGLWTCSVEPEGLPEQFLDGVYDSDEADLVEVTERSTVELGPWTVLDGIGASGTILGPAGPVEGASVHIYASSQVITVGSDEDGLYEGWAVPTGALLVWASSDGLATSYYPDADRPETFVDAYTEGELVDAMDIELPAEATLSGRLVGDVDLSGVTVLLYNDSHTVGRGALVAEDGSFVIDSLHGGDYQLYVYASDEGFLDDWIRDADGEAGWYSLQAEGDNQAGEQELPLGTTVTGTVTTEEGEPVYGAFVYASEQDGELVEVVSTDRQGSYRLTGIQGGRWQLKARYAHYCEADPGFVTVYWDQQVYELRSDWQDFTPGERLEGYDFSLPSDDDHDAMGDTWEREHGLDPERDDSHEDLDGDGYSNLEEYYLGTDPGAVFDEGGCGCRRGEGQLAWLPLLLLPPALRRRRYGRRTSNPHTGSPFS